MAWKVALCDDEDAVCRQLSDYLEQFSAQRGEALEVAVFHSAEALLASPEEYSVLLLDIQMDGMSGMNAARELRRRGSGAVIFFITSMAQYAIEGYEVHAFSFLVKPLRYPVFAQRMEDALCSLRRRAGQQLCFRTAEGLVQVNTNEVCYIESFRHQIRFSCTRFTFTEGERSLSVLARELEPCGFFRVHKSYLVNMGNIRLIGESEISMANGEAVPLSRHRRREFLSAYAAYRKELL